MTVQKCLLFTSICLMLVFLLAGCAGSAPESNSNNVNLDEILTEWGELTLILPENEEVGEYFIKTERQDDGDAILEFHVLDDGEVIIQDDVLSINENLDEWLGWYVFSEFCPPNINMFYSVNILKKEDEYIAYLYIDGFQTLKRIKSTVSGDSERVDIRFLCFMPESIVGITEPYVEDTLILTFRKSDSAILTEWGELTPILPEHEEVGEYFVKTEQQDDGDAILEFHLLDDGELIIQGDVLSIDENLDDWLGWYEFSEFCPPNINRYYRVNILREDDEYTALVFIDGYQILKVIRANASGNEAHIELLFESFLPDSIVYDFEPYVDGTLILTFRKNDSILLTEWGALSSILPENKEVGEYFIKTE